MTLTVSVDKVQDTDNVTAIQLVNLRGDIIEEYKMNGTDSSNQYFKVEMLAPGSVSI